MKVKKASLTVEASLVLPVFLFAMLLIAYLGQMIKCQNEMQWALTRIAREASAEYGATKSEVFKSHAYYLAKLNLYLKGMGISVSLLESELLKENDEINLSASYHIKLPFRLLNTKHLSLSQRVHTRAFTGVESRESTGGQEEVTVYITETGRVYHRKLDCTYLKLSISQILYGDVSGMRNESGGRYKPCERCCKGKTFTGQSVIWITNFGDRYHSSRSCSGIKRSILTIKFSEVGNRTPCSKCGEEGRK
ncbi:MAG: pilus assembly protein [Lachnospiraceae bacterium]|nr:pilus assembly protein [Lachnospiraceae bacterium]